MTRDLKQRWIEALRSGKYKQGTGTLRRGSCFCAMGVLCELHNPSGWEFLPDNGWCYQGLTTLALTLEDENIINHKEVDAVVTLNDGDRKSFSEIADWIEANVVTED